MSDLVQRLREQEVQMRKYGYEYTADAITDAADEIERLQKALGECSGALQSVGHPLEWQREIERLKRHVSDLQENGERLRLIADEAVAQQREMIDAATKPLHVEIERLEDRDIVRQTAISNLHGEIDRLTAERDALRQLLREIRLGLDWPGPWSEDMRDRIDAVTSERPDLKSAPTSPSAER